MCPSDSFFRTTIRSGRPKNVPQVLLNVAQVCRIRYDFFSRGKFGTSVYWNIRVDPIAIVLSARSMNLWCLVFAWKLADLGIRKMFWFCLWYLSTCLISTPRVKEKLVADLMSRFAIWYTRKAISFEPCFAHSTLRNGSSKSIVFHVFPHPQERIRSDIDDSAIFWERRVGVLADSICS